MFTELRNLDQGKFSRSFLKSPVRKVAKNVVENAAIQASSNLTPTFHKQMIATMWGPHLCANHCGKNVRYAERGEYHMAGRHAVLERYIASFETLLTEII